MKKIPVGISGRHIHVSQEHLEILFGKGYELKVFRDLSQPGQYAAEEKVDLISPQGRILEGVRILGPARNQTQIEISRSDALRFRFDAPVKHSGDIEGSGACKVVGPKGSVELKEGVIISSRHIHFSLEDAKEFGVKNNELVSLKIGGEKPGVLHNVLCRVNENFRLDAHLDTDDGSAFLLQNGDMLELIKQ